MGKLTYIVAALLAVLLAGCGGGGGPFVPDPGPFTGDLVVDGTVVGSITFTATASSIGGTGNITHNEQVQVITVSANVFDNVVDGFLQNANLGHGPIEGVFLNKLEISGTFSYSDAAGLTTQTGTWIATAEQ